MATIARRLSWMGIGVLFVLFLCHQWFGPDIWYHLYLGERIFRTGSPQPADNLLFHQADYVNTYWLFQLVVRGLFALGGIYSVSFFFLALWSVALGAWLATTGLLRAGAWAALAALAAVLMCQTRFEQRPEVVSYVFLALQVYWLAQGRLEEGPAAKKWPAFLAVQAAWANVHGYFALGPLLVGAKLTAALVRPGPKRGRARLALLLGLALLASLASPFGVRNWEEVAVLGRFFRQMHYSIQEFLPPTRVPAPLWSIRVFEAYWWAILAGLAVVAARAARREAFALLLGGLGLLLGMTALRNIPLLVFLSAPLLAAVRPSLARFRPPAAATGVAIIAVSAALAAAVVSGRYYLATGGVPGFGLRESRYAYPVQFSGYLRASGFSGSLFNNPGDGGYLEFHFPGLRLYGDTRFVDPAPVRGYFAALGNSAALDSLQKQWGFDAVLLRVAESPYVVADRLRKPGWALAYADLHRVFLVNRRTPAGSRLSLHPPRFYDGEDLTVPVNGASATAWAGIFVVSGDRSRLLSALRQFSRARAIPAGLLKFALEYAQGHSDPEMSILAKALRPNLIPAPAEDTAAIDRLIQGRP